MPSILFVCTGNICRSPMAVALFRRLVRPERSHQPWRIESAGTRAAEGLPASQNSQIAMADLGLDIRDHRSRPVDLVPLEDFDLILTMEADQKEALQIEFPHLAGRIFQLSEMAGETHDIDDPIGGPLDEYEATAREIDRLLAMGFRRILALAQGDDRQPGDPRPGS